MTLKPEIRCSSKGPITGQCKQNGTAVSRAVKIYPNEFCLGDLKQPRTLAAAAHRHADAAKAQQHHRPGRWLG